MAKPFRKTATIDDFDMDTTVSLKSGKWIELMNMKIPAQQIRNFGNGFIINGVDDRGIFKLDVKTSGDTNIPGTCRLTVSDANYVNRYFLREDRSEDLTEGIRLPYTKPAAGEDSYLIVEYKPDSDADADATKTSISMPLTYTNL